MKLNKLLVLGSVFALAACAPAKPVVLDEAKAIERAEQIAASQETIEVGEFSAQIVNYVEEGEESFTSTAEIVIDIEAKYFYLGQTYVSGEEQGQLQQWAYVQGDTFYVVGTGENGGNEIIGSFKTSELGSQLDDFGALINVLCDTEDLLADFGADLYGDMLLSAEAITNLFASATPEMMEILGFTSLEFTAASKGEGHLILDTAATADFSVDGFISLMSIHEAYVWENNLVVEYVNDMVLLEGDVTSVYNEHHNYSYNVTPEYPLIG